MSLFVFDTDSLSLWQHGQAAITQNVESHASDELAITIITVQEQLDGWHARLPRAKDRKQIAEMYQRLADTVKFLSRVRILPFSELAIDRYDQLRALKLNVGKMDLRIASIALQFGGIVITCNTRDFSRVPGLRIEDWSVNSYLGLTMAGSQIIPLPLIDLITGGDGHESLAVASCRVAAELHRLPGLRISTGRLRAGTHGSEPGRQRSRFPRGY